MANIASAKKRIRTTARRTEININRRSRMRTFTRQAEEAIVAGDKDLALVAFRKAESQIARARKAGIIHKNNAARKTSRLHARLKAMA